MSLRGTIYRPLEASHWDSLLQGWEWPHGTGRTQGSLWQQSQPQSQPQKRGLSPWAES